nr:MAG TPA: hypothetical protein [Caudoviricetes sp.]
MYNHLKYILPLIRKLERQNIQVVKLVLVHLH